MEQRRSCDVLVIAINISIYTKDWIDYIISEISSSIYKYEIIDFILYNTECIHVKCNSVNIKKHIDKYSGGNVDQTLPYKKLHDIKIQSRRIFMINITNDLFNNHFNKKDDYLHIYNNIEKIKHNISVINIIIDANKTPSCYLNRIGKVKYIENKETTFISNLLNDIMILNVILKWNNYSILLKMHHIGTNYKCHFNLTDKEFDNKIHIVHDSENHSVKYIRTSKKKTTPINLKRASFYGCYKCNENHIELLKTYDTLFLCDNEIYCTRCKSDKDIPEPTIPLYINNQHNYLAAKYYNSKDDRLAPLILKLIQSDLKLVSSSLSQIYVHQIIKFLANNEFKGASEYSLLIRQILDCYLNNEFNINNMVTNIKTFVQNYKKVSFTNLKVQFMNSLYKINNHDDIVNEYCNKIKEWEHKSIHARSNQYKRFLLCLIHNIKIIYSIDKLVCIFKNIYPIVYECMLLIYSLKFKNDLEISDKEIFKLFGLTHNDDFINIVLDLNVVSGSYHFCIKLANYYTLKYMNYYRIEPLKYDIPDFKKSITKHIGIKLTYDIVTL